jgi:hypothetical protein
VSAYGAPATLNPAGLATVGGAFTAGLTVGAATRMADATYRAEAGNFYLEMRAQGMDDLTSRVVSHAVGLFNMTAELTGEAAMTRVFRRELAHEVGAQVIDGLAKPTLGRALRQSAADFAVGVTGETATEIAQEVSNIVGEEVLRGAAGRDMRLATAEGQASIVDQLAGIALETLYGVGALASIGPAGGAIRGALRAQKAAASEKFFADLAKGVKSTKLAGRSPTALQRFLQAAIGDGPAETTYVAGESLRQAMQASDVTVAELDRLVPGAARRCRPRSSARAWPAPSSGKP